MKTLRKKVGEKINRIMYAKFTSQQNKLRAQAQII